MIYASQFSDGWWCLHVKVLKLSWKSVGENFAGLRSLTSKNSLENLGQFWENEVETKRNCSNGFIIT